MIKVLSPQEAKVELGKGALLVDVRELEEIEEFACDVPGTLAMPLSVFSDKCDELPKDRDLILVCAGGGRSLYAATLLTKLGYERVANLDGGVFMWNSVGLPVKKAGAGAESSVNSCKLW
ncbi:rhodanese-like domain-containing protein [Candidatus Falkowbacteria bacterium]|nr:rhodanese-like domain-containing protein [Candidatus Falkowbacteria bacterium]